MSFIAQCPCIPCFERMASRVVHATDTSSGVFASAAAVRRARRASKASSAAAWTRRLTFRDLSASHWFRQCLQRRYTSQETVAAGAVGTFVECGVSP